MARPVVDRVHITERHDLEDDRGAVIGCVATEVDESILHARNIGNQFFGTRMMDVLWQTRRDLDVSSAESLGNRKDLTAVLVGFLAALAVEIPIDKEFELEIFDAVGGEDALHLGIADLGRGCFDIVGNHSDAFPASAGRGLDPIRGTGNGLTCVGPNG